MTDTLPALPHTLDPLRCPLTGTHLIEASAGTGKTFTIALLYLRLILGHLNGRPLQPPEILVVTFTEAATQELRARIRLRLAEAAACFRESIPTALANAVAVSATSPGHDAVLTAGSNLDPLHRLRADYPPEAWPLCARRLELAAEWMDEAAISTIHGWCYRMLREHAFASQSLFSQTLESDFRALLSDTVRDYWRRFYYPLPTAASAEIVRLWPSPEALEKALKNFLPGHDALPLTAEPAQQLASALSTRTHTLAHLKSHPWAEWTVELAACFAEGRAQGKVNAQKLQPRYYDTWFDILRQWADSDQIQPPLSDSAWERLSPEGIAAVWKSGTPPDHPLLKQLPEVRSALEHLPDPRTDLLCHAARWIAETSTATRKRRAQMGFDDLLLDLDKALHGPDGEPLADTLRQQFPVALIDEFQDTDPCQYRIFNRIYPLAENRQDCALLLIGDPKQAIYAFRGADIYTYLQARAAVGERLSTLSTNFRATEAMVAASNHCFACREADQEGPGAFLFRRGDINPVPFLPARAQGRLDAFVVAGQTLPALLLAVPDTPAPLGKEAYTDSLAELCATQVVDWLNRSQMGEAGFIAKAADESAAPPHPLRPLTPGDMAVLVNNGSEARAVRRALARRGVRTVYLSDRDSVFATPQARDLQCWLQACADPDNDRALRAALITPTLGLSFAELDALNQDEMAWETRVVQFKGYRHRWQTQGVLPMLRRLVHDFHCHARLLVQDLDVHGQSGERILTDLLHLAELLQTASSQLDGEHALLRFLAEQIAAPGAEADSQKLRLESDANLLQVVTVHKAKGLEYPLVFLPFASATRSIKEESLPLKWHDEDGHLHLALQVDRDILARADRERLGEDLRKLYVGLTRARYLTWLGLAPLKNGEPSAIGHLLGLNESTSSDFSAAVDAFSADQPHIARLRHLTPNDTVFAAAQDDSGTGKARRAQRPARDHWCISSYSALPLAGQRASLASMAPPPEDSAQTAHYLEERQAPASEALIAPTLDTPDSRMEPPALLHSRPAGVLHSFPQGPEAGTFLHELMEWALQSGPTSARQALTDPAKLRETLLQHSRPRGWERWLDPLCAWMNQMLSTPLPLGGTACRLGELSTARVEMEFWFAVHTVDLLELDKMLCATLLPGLPRPALAAGTLNGLLKGFMDLVFEHEGRYYVLDYKSNRLGNHDAAYTVTAMNTAICAHRYDLQYALYLLALHRLLRSRLPDYDYAQHMGGAVYLFVRGLGGPECGVHFARPPRSLIDALDALFRSSEEDHA